MRRLAAGSRLALGSLRVVRAVPLLLLPGLVHAAAVVGVCSALAVSRGQELVTSSSLLLLAGALLVTSVVGTLAAAVVVAVVADRMEGASAGLRDGLAAVRPRVPALLGWAVLNATVGTLLRAVEERLGPVGRLVTAGVGTLFSLATLLVVPVVVREGGSPVAALRRSSALFRRAWGESVVGDVGLGLVLGLVLLPGYVVGLVVVAVAGTVPGLVVLAVVLGVHLSAGATASAVLAAALHRYATVGDAGPFGDLSALFRPRARRYVPSYAAPHGQWDAS